VSVDAANSVKEREMMRRISLVPPRITRTLFAGAVAIMAAAACAPQPAARQAPLPRLADRPPAAPLPAVPAVDGALAIDVVYPPQGAEIAPVDSTFVFGSVGSGRASVTINGVAIEVAPNGAFLAYLAVPQDGVYNVTATRGAESVSAERNVRVAPPPVRSVAGTQIIAGSVYPAAAITLRQGESLEVGFRGTAGGRAYAVLATGERFPLPQLGVAAGALAAEQFQVQPGAPAPAPVAGNVARYAGMLPVRALRAQDTALARPRLVADLPRHIALTQRDSLIERCAAAVAAGQRLQQIPDCTPVALSVDSLARARTLVEGVGAHVELVVGTDTARAPMRLNLGALPPDRTPVAVATFPGDGAVPWDWTVRGRPHVTGPFHYFWPHGTRLAITGERDNMLRVQLAGGLTAWVPASDVRMLPSGAALPAAVIGSARFAAHATHIDLRVPAGERLPFHVQLEDPRTLDVFLYGATSAANFFQYGSLDPLMESAEWRQPADGVFHVRVRLTQPVWGYMAFYDEAGAFTLRIRRPPVIDATQPLRGLLIAVDPGHPPGGAIGPTRLTEADANLFISQRLRPMLEAAGARVLMIRDDTSTVALADRPRMSTEANADVFVSVHNNAFPDGVNPFVNHGTSMYYYHPHSVDLAQAMQNEVLAEIGLPDIGIGRADLAVIRQSWMPSVLTELTFMMFPDQEAALRDPGFQERLARAHLRALERFLLQRAQWQR
jgi:N-acetylmuramoyl-L-alanine amidase